MQNLYSAVRIRAPPPHFVVAHRPAWRQLRNGLRRAPHQPLGDSRRVDMAEVLRRAGPPKAADLKGEEFTWTIQLSAAPSREWSRLFSEPAESTVLCHPRRLGMMHQALVFKSDEGHLTTWVQYIDKWIGGANKGMQEQEEAERQRKTKALAEEEERQKRIREVNEKVKNL